MTSLASEAESFSIPLSRTMTGRSEKKIIHLAHLAVAITLGTTTTSCQLLLPLPPKDLIRTETDGKYSWRTYEHLSLMTEQQLGWINNETVLVVGYSKPEGSGIYAWNPGNRPRMVLKQGYRFCFDGNTWTAIAAIPKKGENGNEYIRYEINPKNLDTTVLGAMRREAGFNADSYFTCNNENLPQILKGRGLQILRPSDGFLDFGQHGAMGQPLTLIKADTTTRIRTHILLSNPLSTLAQYNLYPQSYLIYSLGFNPNVIEAWKAKNQHTIWKMQPNGSATTITIPAGPWLDTGGGDKSFAISKPGLLISSKGYGEPHQWQAGVFLLRGDRSHSKISSGSSERLSVSPNGCRVAWSVDRPKASGICDTGGHASR
jgi:hypothetical protein